jgi:hypothetical protein
MQRWQNGSKVLHFNSGEEYFSTPIKSKPLYYIDYKRTEKEFVPYLGIETDEGGIFS